MPCPSNSLRLRRRTKTDAYSYYSIVEVSLGGTWHTIPLRRPARIAGSWHLIIIKYQINGRIFAVSVTSLARRVIARFLARRAVSTNIESDNAIRSYAVNNNGSSDIGFL